MQAIEIQIQVNNQEHTLEVSPDATLLRVLREQLGLGSAREGCGIGMCGTCTVLVNGQAFSSCLLLAAQVQGTAITTVEGLSRDGKLHPVQLAFLEEAAFQCAFCTPGFILTTVALLADHPNPDEDTIREYFVGNLCRCGSHENILKAVQRCAAMH